MASPAPSTSAAPPRLTVEQYLGLVAQGVLGPEDRVELLGGVVVAMVASNPSHATAVSLVAHVLDQAVGPRAGVRCQLSLVAGGYSVPEPDVAVVPGHLRDYATAHPTSAHLVVEVADTSLPQDRLSKAPIYAAAGIPEYWIVNLRARRVEVFRGAEPEAGRYREVVSVGPGDHLEVTALPGVRVAVDDLLP